MLNQWNIIFLKMLFAILIQGHSNLERVTWAALLPILSLSCIWVPPIPTNVHAFATSLCGKIVFNLYSILIILLKNNSMTNPWHYSVIIITNAYLGVSEILKNEPVGFEKKLGEWVPKRGDWSICWRATRDGWAASTFHSRCDGKSPTITIIQVIKNSKKFVFGGYATVPWKQGIYIFHIFCKFEIITVIWVIILIINLLLLIGFVTCMVRQWLQLLWYRHLLIKLDKNTIRIC